MTRQQRRGAVVLLILLGLSALAGYGLQQGQFWYGIPILVLVLMVIAAIAKESFGKGGASGQNLKSGTHPAGRSTSAADEQKNRHSVDNNRLAGGDFTHLDSRTVH